MNDKVSISAIKERIAHHQEMINIFRGHLQNEVLEGFGLKVGDNVTINGEPCIIKRAIGAHEVGVECIRPCGGIIKCWRLDKVIKV